MSRTFDARPVRAFIFDMGNVLLDFDFDPAFRRLARVSGKTPQEIRDYFVQSGLEVLFDGGRITARQFHREVDRALELQLPYGRFEKIWNSIFTPDRRMGRLLARLSKRFRTALLSNTNAMHARYFERRYAALLKPLHRRLYSFREKMRKPDDRLYARAAKALGFRPRDIFYIDDRADFTEAAAELGFRTFTYRKNFGELERTLKRLGALA